MKVTLEKWTPAMKQELMNVCNLVDRSYLSNRMPYPYTDESADWWLGMGMTLEKCVHFPQAKMTEEQIKALEEDLKALG